MCDKKQSSRVLKLQREDEITLLASSENEISHGDFIKFVLNKRIIKLLKAPTSLIIARWQTK